MLRALPPAAPLVLAVIATIAGPLVSSAFAQCTFTLDPGFTVGPFSSGTTYSIKAQVFRPSSSGIVCQILHGVNDMGGGNSYNVWVTEAPGEIPPTGYTSPPPSGTYFSSTGETVFNTGGFGATPINGIVNPTSPFVVTAGQYYALIIETVGSSNAWIADTDAGAYPNGAGWVRVGNAWEPSLLPEGAADFAFSMLGLPACTPPPDGMVGWWPGEGTAKDIALSHDGTFVNPGYTAGKVGTAFCFPSNSAGVRIDHASALNPSAQGYTFDAWVNVSYGQIVTKSYGSFGGPGFIELTIDSDFVNDILYLNGAFICPLPLTVVLPTSLWGTWIHVAFVLDPVGPFCPSFEPALGLLYINGLRVADSCISSMGSHGGTGPLYLGGSAGRPVTAIDEVEIFDRALTEDQIWAIYEAGATGKCKHHCAAPWESPYCLNTNTLVATMQICNDTDVQQTYSLSFGGVFDTSLCNGPLLTAANFTVLPPSLPVLGTNPVTVPPGCWEVPVQIDRPVGLNPGKHSCYTLTVRNVANVQVSTCDGSVLVINKWCWKSSDNRTVFNVGETATVIFEVENTGDEGGVLAYTFSVMAPDMTPDMAVVRLNGLPPGTPVKGVLNLPLGQSTTVEVEVEFLEHVLFSFFDLLVSGDENDDGDPSEVMISHSMHSASSSSAPIPTVSEWGLLVLALLMLLGLTGYFGRRQGRAA